MPRPIASTDRWCPGRCPSRGSEGVERWVPPDWSGGPWRFTMPNKDPVIDQLFVDSFNADLAKLDSNATIALTNLSADGDLFELLDSEGVFLTLLPVSATPEVAAAAYKLYGQGLNRGLRAGEELAWSKL